MVGAEVGVNVVGARVGNDVDGVDDGTGVVGACDGAVDGGHVFVDDDPPPGHTQHASLADMPPAPMKSVNAEQSAELKLANQPSMTAQVMVSSRPATETEACQGTPHSGPMLKQAVGAGVSPGQDGASVGTGVGDGVVGTGVGSGVGQEVLGTDVGSEVAGAEVVGSAVVGSMAVGTRVGDVVLRQHDAWHSTPPTKRSVQSATAQSVLLNKVRDSSRSRSPSHAVTVAGVGSGVVSAEVVGSWVGLGVGISVRKIEGAIVTDETIA